MDTFSIRDYCEKTDFDPIHKFLCDYNSKTVAYQLSGTSSSVPKYQLREKLDKIYVRLRYPFIVAGQQSQPIGLAFIEPLVKVCNHQTFHIILWEQKGLTKQVLTRTLRTIFSNPDVSMAICQVTGDECELVTACREVGMEQVGCIPDYYCYDGQLYSEYTFMIKNNNRF